MAATARRPRADGEESKERILDAATEIAGERGYEGTSISLVSERSGLPASSIYWHFDNKDALIAAVIERSYGRWLADAGAFVPVREGVSRKDQLVASLQQTAKALLESGDFLRLGLMLTLERRPEQPAARALFLQVRAETQRRAEDSYRRLFPELDAAGISQLASLTMAAADGLFIAREVDGDAFDHFASFETLAAAVLGAAEHLAARSDHSTKGAQ
jgi:AcrR family transcriptional regulator